MNRFLKTQCQSMIFSVEIFEQSCILAVKEDDGRISKEEEQALKRIHTAAKAFKKELSHACELQGKQHSP